MDFNLNNKIISYLKYFETNTDLISTFTPSFQIIKNNKLYLILLLLKYDFIYLLKFLRQLLSSILVYMQNHFI